MAEWTDTKDVIGKIQKRHVSESGKVIQKLLALTLVRLGYDHLEERSVQGVDIDVIKNETGERHSFEVKTSKTHDVSIGKKDIDGLEAREEDGYKTYFAILCFPLCFTEGWIIIPASSVKEGRYSAMGLLRKRDKELSELVNSVFPDVVEDVEDGLLESRPGCALHFMKENYGI